MEFLWDDFVPMTPGIGRELFRDIGGLKPWWGLINRLEI
jgi:hypothetical protein